MKNLKTQVNIENTSLNLDQNLPILFDKKSKTTISKQLNYIKSDTGKTRHYTPAAQEWYNSIYSYDSNYIKTLPAAVSSSWVALSSGTTRTFTGFAI